MASADMIAAYLVHHGVTRCPTVAVLPTTAKMPADDHQRVRQYHEVMEEQWIKKSLKQRRKEF